MSVQPVLKAMAVVKRDVAACLITGDDIAVLAKNSLSDCPPVQTYIGHIEAIIWKDGKQDVVIARVPRNRTISVYENILAFKVVDTVDTWDQKILRRA